MAIEAIIGSVAASSGVSVWLTRRLTRGTLRRDLNRVAHEMRRPLQALVLGDGGSPAPFSYARTRSELLDQAMDALGELDVLANGRSDAGRKDLVRVKDLVTARLEALPTLAGPGDARCHWEAGSVLVEGSRVQLSRALDNVLVNAMEHGLPPLVITGSRVGDRLRITICDSGVGGPRRGRIRLERPGSGGSGSSVDRRRSDQRRGHGLSVVESIVRAHGGRLLTNWEQGGAVVSLELPIARPGRLTAA